MSESTAAAADKKRGSIGGASITSDKQVVNGTAISEKRATISNNGAEKGGGSKRGSMSGSVSGAEAEKGAGSKRGSITSLARKLSFNRQQSNEAGKRHSIAGTVPVSPTGTLPTSPTATLPAGARSVLVITTPGDKSDSSEEMVQAMMKECEAYDYVRFTMSSITGEQYLKAVPARHLRKFLKTGTRMWEGISLLGTACDVYPSMFEIVGTSNLAMRPQPATAHALPWATRGKFKVGEILCEPVYHDTAQPLKAHPRYVARKQILRLEERGGLAIRAASEMEFMLLESKTLEPITARTTNPPSGTATAHAALEEFMFSVDKYLYESGVNVENQYEELCPGQSEFVLTPAVGINAPDQVFKFKQGIREIAHQKGMLATFMTVPFEDISNGMDFNHSIINKHRRNIFFDATKPDNLSEFAQHWIAGLMLHAKALTALCCPTVNCYRRIGMHWRPAKVNWGIDDRTATFRVKSSCAEFTYIENRLSGGGSNPYIVMAATIAAGLDGVEKRLDCPPAVPMEEAEDELPRTLREALLCLKEDDVICKALGDAFIKWFLQEKEGSQFVAFPDSSSGGESEEKLAKERDFYLKYI